MKRVAVVGAGIAGLTAATHLTRAGAHVTLIESSPHAGGRYATVGEIVFEHAGRTFRFPNDHGLHGFWRQYRNFARFLETAGLAHRQIPVDAQELILSSERGGTRAVEVGARLQNTPLPDVVAPLSLLSSSTLALEAVRGGFLKYVNAGAQVLHAVAFDPTTSDLERYDHLTVSDYLGAWPSWLKRLFCALTHSGFFLDPEEVSLAAFFTGLSVYTISDKRDSSFTTLDDAAGPGLIDPLLRSLESLGAEVLLGTRAQSLEEDGSLWVRDGSGARRLQPDAIVLALDPPGLKALKVPAALAKHFETTPIPRGVPSVAVRLFFTALPKRDRAPSGIFGDERADNFFWLDRLQRPFRAWRQATGGSVLECHLYGSRARNALGQSDEQVIASARAAAEDAWPELAGRCVHGHVQRNAATHVAFTPGTMTRLPGVETPLSHVALAGDFVATPWPTLYLERACLTGLIAARTLGSRLALAAIDEPIRPFPAAASVARARPVLRALRDRGVFPRADLPKRS